MKLRNLFAFTGFVITLGLAAQISAPIAQPEATADGLWIATDGEHINCHGGNILRLEDGTYCWYGEHRVEGRPGISEDGISLYTSRDLRTWKNEGLVFRPSEDLSQKVSLGCLMERPKVVYNRRTRKFVMFFHLELSGKGYAFAGTGIAVADSARGPFRLIHSGRPNAGKWPTDFTRADRKAALALRPGDYKTWWTSEWREAIAKGLFIVRDMDRGQMSRDMTVYVDDDNRAYHIFSSEDNLTLHIAELNRDYTDYTGRYWRIAPAGQNEAPVIFKQNGYYWLITSGCTGWAPNAARLFRSKKITGPYEQLPCPTRGPGADKTFGAQGTFALPDPDRPGHFIFMADIWTPKQLSHSRHLWIPIRFENGLPVLEK